MPLEERAGHQTYWQKLSDGPHKVLAFHCSLAHSGSFTALAQELDGLASVVAFDQPGHGQSADWDGHSDYAEQTLGIAETFLDESDEPVDIIGHSYGGVLAIALAMRVPERIRTVTLIEPVLYAALRGTEAWDLHFVELSKIHAAFDAGDPAGATRHFIATFGEDSWESFPEAVREKMTTQIGAVLAGEDLTHGEQLFKEDGLEGLTMPVMLVYGTGTHEVMPTVCENIAARLPDVGVATIEGAGHMLTLTHPEKLAGLIEVNLTRA